VSRPIGNGGHKLLALYSRSRYHTSVDLLRSLLVGLLAALLAGCGTGADNALLLPADSSSPPDTSRLTLVARIVQITDTHAVDAESPARFAGAHDFVYSAWRPWEMYSTQILDGIVRTANRIHASGQRIDFAIHTGDACDNVQSNELGWFLSVMDGGLVNPLSGPDDRPNDARPPLALDPYAPFDAQGFYRQGVQGDLPSIPWYALLGNHDTFAIGNFPIVESPDGVRVAPLPLSCRPGILLPNVLDPTGSWSHGNVTPANPGPPAFLTLPSYVTPNTERAYFSKREFVHSLFGTATGPAGHGFQDPDSGPTWYSVSPLPGLRLIALDTADVPGAIPTLPYSEGCISEAQREFLLGELDAASGRGELVILATHHPSRALVPGYGSALAPQDLRDMLNAYPNVVLHIAGHTHENRVAQRGGYVEIETCSTLDLPQEGRVIEVRRDNTDGSVLIGYRMFSHIDDTLPPLGDDPLRAMREQARAIAEKDGSEAQWRPRPADDADAQLGSEGSLADRAGVIRLTR
jgi:3',5'-cyclic AMP phosphodiesterase CpdA